MGLGIAALAALARFLAAPVPARAQILANGNFEAGPVIPLLNPILAVAPGSGSPTREQGMTLTLQAGMKLPTGRRHVPDEERMNFGLPSELHPSARPGSGSTDWLAGARWSQPLPWRGALPLTASVLARWNGRGTDDYRVGDGLEAGLATGHAPLAWLTLLGQLNYSAHGDDRPAHAGAAVHAGRRALHASPGVSVRVAPVLAVYALVQARVWGETDEATIVAPRQFLIGTTLTPPR